MIKLPSGLCYYSILTDMKRTQGLKCKICINRVYNAGHLGSVYLFCNIIDETVCYAIKPFHHQSVVIDSIFPRCQLLVRCYQSTKLYIAQEFIFLLDYTNQQSCQTIRLTIKLLENPKRWNVFILRLLKASSHW